MAQKGTLTGSYDSTVTLSTAAYTDPVTITGIINAGTSNFGLGALYAPGGATVWTIRNQGLVEAPAYGKAIDIGSSGSVDNAAGAVIAGGSAAQAYKTGNGVFIGDSGQILNAGSITGGAVIGNGGTFSNATTGYVGVKGVYIRGGHGVVVNDGRIVTGNGYPLIGVGMRAYGGNSSTVQNAVGAFIYGAGHGVFVTYDPGFVTNAGTITGGTGIQLSGGGQVTNVVGGMVSASSVGVSLRGGPSTLTNASTIVGGNIVVALDNEGTAANAGLLQGQGLGVRISAGGTFLNEAGATDAAPTGVYGKYLPGTVINHGLISATGYGVTLNDGGSVTNAADGTISGPNLTAGVVFANHDGTLDNAGTIDPVTAVRFAAGFHNRLVLHPGQSMSGVADGGNTIGNSIASVIELAAGTGTLSDIGSSFQNFGSIVFDAGAQWGIDGSTAGLGGGETISGFAPGDTISLLGVGETGYSFNNGTLTLTGGPPLELLLPGAHGAFGVTEQSGNTDITVACFAGGTRILTPAGEVAVEALRVGGLVVNRRGNFLPIAWIGHRRVDYRRHPRPQDVWPVRVRASAFAVGIPARDLVLSPDHAVYIEGILVPVRYLLNGATVVLEPVSQVTYWHVELARHEVLLAEGMPVESYLDTGNRAVFTNDDVAIEPTGVGIHPLRHGRRRPAINDYLVAAPKS